MNAPAESTVEEPEARLRAIFEAHYELVWRSLRRFGVQASDVDDAAQEVFIVAARRIRDIQPGKERAFVMGCAVRIASESRRASKRRPELEAELSDPVDESPGPEALLDQKRARAILDAILDDLQDDLRVVFTLYELEGMTMAEISKSLNIASGTVASRLRRAREVFQASANRVQARLARETTS